MVLTVILVLLIVGFLFLMASRFNPPWADLWVAVLFLYIIELLRALPLGK